MSFRKIIFISLLFILSILPLFPENNNSVLFLNSEPINCRVKIDNKKINQETPLLLKSIEPGKHIVEIRKEGFIPVKAEITVDSEKNNIYSFKMDAENNEEICNAGIDKSYPNQRFIDSLNIVIPVLAGFSAALTYNELSNPRYSDSLLSPFVYSTYAVNTVLIGADIAFHIHKNSYKKKNETKKIITCNSGSSIDGGLLYFEKGNNAFQEENFDKAIAEYGEILNNYRDSPLFPSALYKSAVINMINEEYRESLKYFTEIINNYPEAELYDKSLKNLAEIYIMEKDYKKAVSAMNGILFIDNTFSEKEIENRIHEILDMEKEKHG